MAAKGKKPSAAVEIPECPVCLEPMSAPIFLCASGHSLCSSCTQAMCPPICPICRQAMTQMRNRSLEEIIGKAKTPCPNRAQGCVYALPSEALAAHAAECLFRPRECPHAVFGKCSWTGDLKKLMEHFKEKHSGDCVPHVDADAGWRLEVNGFELKECARHVYLAGQQNFLFIVTFKVDTIQRMAYWTIQHIGQKKVARQHIYEIHIISKRDAQRKVVFTEYCFNDTMKADEVFRQSNCAVLPLDMLAHFIQDKKLSFRFNIKRLTGTQNKENEDDVAHQARAPRSQSRGRDASQCSETRGPGPKPHWKKPQPGQKGPGPKKGK